ncbi:MAG: hypothetical protein DRH12_14425 [Deltaproteobacteria bacterium]|nr:MAG: hypothetical protein DRH12_14425 [Deltaproteobacteria bacterium]
MRTYLDCYSCFLRHGLEASRIAGLSEAQQKRVLDEIMRVLQDMRAEATPPELAQVIHKRIREMTGGGDPYKQVKEEQNRLMLSIEESLKREVEEAPRPLVAALKLAGACNAIDMGPTRTWKTSEELIYQLRHPNLDHFEERELLECLTGARNLLYVADNAGEIVGDKILLSAIRREMPSVEITIAVRGGPILNDATMEDAIKVGIDKLGRIITTGSDAPGAILSSCSKEFTQCFQEADVVIAKGQGNYEALEGCEKEDLFFLLQVKCAVVARDLDAGKGKITLRKNRR